MAWNKWEFLREWRLGLDVILVLGTTILISYAIELAIRRHQRRQAERLAESMLNSRLPWQGRKPKFGRRRRW